MEKIGIVSNLEDLPYRDVKKLWALFERKYNSKAIQAYSHPHFTYQIAKTSDVKRLKVDFEKVTSGITPFEIEVIGLRHFRKDVIYLGLKRMRELAGIHRLIHRFLETNCQGLLDLYAPEHWIPHITLAMEDLTEENFGKAWGELQRSRIRFKQTLHNVCMVKWTPDGKIRIAKRYKLGTGTT